jgi:hypothetical protein
MSKECELLSRLAYYTDTGKGASLTLEEFNAFERELGKFYMPQIDSNVTDEELIDWGQQFKKIVAERLEMFRKGEII